MGNSIPLSPKHGLNPTIPVCAWCGEPKNEIALMGRIKTDKRGEDPQAPMHCVLDYNPCDHCKEQWDRGVVVFEATTRVPTPYRPPMQKQPDGTEIYPTMRYVVITPEAANRMFNVGTQFEVGSKMFLEDEAFEQIFGGAMSND